MTDLPPRISLFRMARLCFLALFYPSKFADEEVTYMRLTFGSTAGDTSELRNRVYVVRQAFWRSLVVCTSASLVGILVSWIAGWFMTKGTGTATWIGTAGAGILLWGTLAVRGWDIQTFKGITLTERVNRWLFAALYWIGTATLVTATSWTVFGQNI